MTARKGSRTRRRLRANRLIMVVLVLLALAGLYGVAGLSRPVALNAVTSAGSPGKVPVMSALLGCPAPGSGGTTGGGIGEASVPTSAGPGQVALTPLDPASGLHGGRTKTTSPQPGQLTVVSIKKAPAVPPKLATMPRMAGGLVATGVGRGGLIYSAVGSNAQGLDVQQLGPDSLPTARCGAPGSDFWFLGPGTTKLHTELYLLNVDSVAASADVSVQTDSGPLLGKPDSGIVVPPHGMVIQSLGKLLHSAKAIALHVTTSSGRIVAAVRESTNPSKPGIWLPVAQQPATTQVLAGLPSTPGARELYLTVPGNSAAQVRVTAISPRGSYQPTGGNAISLLGHLTTGISIPSLGGIAGSIKITSSAPVTAVLQVPGGPAGSPGAFAAGSDAIAEQGVIATSPVGKAGKTELELSAPARAASVRITEAEPGSSLTGLVGKVVHIKARSAVELPISLPKGSTKSAKGSSSNALARRSLIAIVVTPLPGSGPVYAARVILVGGAVQTILPVVSSPTAIPLPAARESLLSVLG